MKKATKDLLIAGAALFVGSKLLKKQEQTSAYKTDLSQDKITGLGGTSNLVGGSVKNDVLNKLKKGSIVEVLYESSFGFGDDKPKRYEVTRRQKVNKGKVDKITMRNIKNPKGVKSFFYIRSSGHTGMAVGNSAVSVKKFKIIRQ